MADTWWQKPCLPWEHPLVYLHTVGCWCCVSASWSFLYMVYQTHLPRHHSLSHIFPLALLSSVLSSQWRWGEAAGGSMCSRHSASPETPVALLWLRYHQEQETRSPWWSAFEAAHLEQEQGMFRYLTSIYYSFFSNAGGRNLPLPFFRMPLSLATSPSPIILGPAP